MLDGDTKMDLFKPFDFTMLGDIHKRQQIDKEGRIWYCGSTIQQNYGESGEKGFLLWDIRSKDDWDVDFYPVSHANPFVTVEWQGSVQATVKECQNWPQGARFRIKSSRQLEPKHQRKLSNVLTREWKADEVVYKLGSKALESSLTDEQAKVEVEDLSQTAVHKKLLREYYGEDTEPKEFWQEVDRIVDSLIPRIGSRIDAMGSKWSLRKMCFDNTFGYGENNAIDFSKLNGIVGLFGKNRSGKSSIPGTMMYSLFNANDRGIVGIQHVINTRKQHCAADITVSVNGKLYRLERQSVRYPARGKRAGGAMTYLNVYEVDSDGCIIKDISGEQRKDTEKSVKALIGGPEDFMMTSFAAQGNMNAFINNGSTERKRILSSFLGLDVFDELHKLVKDDAAGVKSLMKRLEAKDWVAEIRKERAELKGLSERKADLEVSKTEIDSRLRNLRNMAEADYGDDWVDPVVIEQTERKLARKLTQTKKWEKFIEDCQEGVSEINERLAKYEKLKSRISIESIKRSIDTLSNLEKGLKDLQHNQAMAKQVLDSKKKLAKKLEPCDCFEHLPTCQYVKKSDENKRIISEQEEKVATAIHKVEEMSQEVLQLQSQDLHNKVSRYEAMLRKESADKIALVRLESKIKSHADDLERASTEISVIRQQLVELRLKADEDKSQELKKLQQQIKEVAEERDCLNDEWLNSAEQIGRKHAKILQLQKEQAEYDALLVEWKVHDFLIKATSWRGIPTYIMSRNLPAINSELSSILQDVTGFSVELEVDERNTDVFLNYGDSRRPIECASGMEKMVSSMALRVALSNLSALNKSDMFIVDEGFGSLDPQNIEAVTNLLHRLKNYYRLIIIISHVDVVKDSVDEIIEITKSGKDSKVVYE